MGITTQATRLQQVNQYLGKSLAWQSFAQGSSNTLYLAAEQGWVLRFNADEALAFGVDRAKEARILQQLQTYSWSPHIIENQVEQGWCIMQHYQPVTHLNKADLLAAVNEWQRMPITNLPHFDYQNLITQYEQALAQSPDQTIQTLLTRFKQGLSELPNLPLTLVHHDLHAKNLCQDREQVIVIDWEYAGVGYAWFDLVALHEQFDIGVQDLASLAIVEKLSLSEIQQGLKQASQLNQQLTSLWYWVRGQAYEMSSSAISNKSAITALSMP